MSYLLSKYMDVAYLRIIKDHYRILPCMFTQYVLCKNYDYNIGSYMKFLSKM
jgi:hypothetical protein